MDAKTIYQNMTKGEWVPSNETILNDRYVKVCQFFNKMEEDYENKNANKAAICSAVNSTYGKGINPESVWQMLNQLKEYVEFCEREPQRMKNTFYKDFKKVLASANL